MFSDNNAQGSSLLRTAFLKMTFVQSHFGFNGKFELKESIKVKTFLMNSTTLNPPNSMDLNLPFEKTMTSNVGGNKAEAEGQPIVNLNLNLKHKFANKNFFNDYCF